VTQLLQRFLAVAVAGLALLAAPLPAGARDSAWPLYSNPEFGFSARFPGTPTAQRESQPVNGVPTTQVIVQYPLGNDTGLMIGATRFEGGFTDPAAALKGAVDNVVAGSKGPVVSREPIQIQGAPGERLVFKPEGDYAVSAVILVKDGVLYDLLAIGHGAPPKEAAEFQQSFTLLDTP
jgi:hypothetical protein